MLAMEDYPIGLEKNSHQDHDRLCSKLWSHKINTTQNIMLQISQV